MMHSVGRLVFMLVVSLTALVLHGHIACGLAAHILNR